MNKLYRGMWGKLLALVLAVGIFLAPVANALTPDQLKVLLEEYYLNEVTDAILEEMTVEGILDALGDPYTEYMNAEEYQEMLQSMLDEETGGIGVSAAMAEEGLLIITIFEESPADKLGLKPGDLIISVGSRSTKGQTADTVTGWLKGDVGTSVTFTVRHQDSRTADYTAVRETIVVPGTTYQMVSDRVGYINCKTFGQQTLEHFLEALEELKEASVWLVDMRSNLGGEVYAVSQTLSVFIGKSNITYLKDGSDQYILFRSELDAETISPMIVLTSGWTASAAEIFAGVIRDKGQGLLVGERTYGKGVAQIILDSEQYESYFPDGDALRVTAYRYYTSSGSTADQVGVIPHLLVDAVQAPDIAMLLTEKEPLETAREGYLQIILGKWRWHLNLETATSEDHIESFTRLLEAIPPKTTIRMGNKANEWVDTTVAQLVDTYKLEGYVFRGFSDVADSAFGDKINTLATYEIVQGDDDGLFYPEASMTRAELCALLVQALNLSNTRSTSAFTDVTEGNWYVDAVNAAYANGLVDGYGDGTFLPEETLTNEELITVMAKVGTTLNAFLYESSKEYDPQQHTVANSYSEWARQWVWLLSMSQTDVTNNVVNMLFDGQNRINPEQEATREDAAAMLYNILTYIKILPI